MSLPRVLIFGQPFNLNTGGGITLTNLFQGWDKEKVAVVGTGHMLENLNGDICDTYYQLGSAENEWIFPFNKLQRKYASGLIDMHKVKEEAESSAHKPNIYEKPNLRQRLVDYMFYPSLKYFGIFHRISAIELSDEFCKWLKDFNPEVLYVQIQARDEILFVQKLYAHLKIPLIVHIMDDWPSFISSTGLFKKHWHDKIDKELRTLFNSADILMGISEGMAIEYKKRYGKKFITFHNPINIDFWKQHQRDDYSLNASPTILYAGRMGVGIETSLELIAKAVDKVNKELYMSIQFVLQTLEKLPWFENYTCVEHNSFVQYNDLPRKFAEADFLILPYDFSEKTIRYIKYSMPTKVSEYMVSGTPIIIFSPEETAMVEYAQKSDWAEVVTKNDVDALANTIKRLVENKGLRQTIAQNAIKIAEKNHDSVAVTTQFRELIGSLVK